MEKIMLFSLYPTIENYMAIASSVKIQNILDEIFTAWHVAIRVKYRDDPDWKKVLPATTDVSEELKQYRIDVTSKLIAQPRIGLLRKAWGLFFAEGNKKYLSIAFETAGNQRSTLHLKNTAIKMYHELQSYYHEYATAGNSSPCYLAFLEMERTIQNAHDSLRTSGDEKQKLLAKYSDFSGSLNSSKKSYDSTTPSKNDNKKTQKEIEAEKIFDEVASDIFRKIN